MEVQDCFGFGHTGILIQNQSKKVAKKWCWQIYEAEIMRGVIVRLVCRQSSSDCLLFPSEQKVGEKEEVWMRVGRFMRLKLSVPPHTQCSPHPPTELASRISFQPTFHIGSLSRWWISTMTIPYTCHKREKLKLQLFVYISHELWSPALHLKSWVSRRTTPQTSGFHQSSAIQNYQLDIKRTVLKLQNFIKSK